MGANSDKGLQRPPGLIRLHSSDPNKLFEEFKFDGKTARENSN